MMHSTTKKMTVALMLGALAIATVAPVAEAGHKRYRHKHTRYCSHPVVKHVRYRPHRAVRYVYHRPYRVVHHVSSGPGPVLAGIIGGIALGAALSQGATVSVHYVWDPYCGTSFSSLEAYHAHFDHHSHPWVARVVERDSGDWVDTYSYRDGAWRSHDTQFAYEDGE